jgi:hypothetical protein
VHRVATYRLPSWAPMSGWTFLGRVWLKAGAESCLPHELVHVAQQRRDGWRFYLRYVFSRAWRVRYEAEAYRVDVASGRMTAERAARYLSGPLYLWPCSYEKALTALR